MLKLVVESALFLAMIVCDLAVGRLAFRKNNIYGRSLSAASFGAAFVTSSYLVSVFIENYFWYSVFSSLYFIGVDISLLSLAYFVCCYVRKGEKLHLDVGWKLLLTMYAADILLLLVNPFREVSIHYVYVEQELGHYTYDMYLPYKFHLALSYFVIAVVLFYLVRKAVSVPAFYRTQYEYAILVILLVVLINAFYLYLPSLVGIEILDYSLLGYSVAAALFYLICFVYTDASMMRMLKDHILANIDMGILLFDYENRLVLKNERAQELLKGVSWLVDPTVEDAARLAAGEDYESLLKSGTDGQSVVSQCYLSEEEKVRPLKCTYSVLLGSRDGILGRLFLFSELSSEYDTLTGFYYWDSYKHRQGHENKIPAAAVACDISGLALLNSVEGRSVGDQAIQQLARVMRGSFPEGTIFVRGREAVLIAVCEGKQEAFMRECVQTMREKLDTERKENGKRHFVFQYGICLSSAEQSHSDLIRGAMKSLDTKKLTDESSSHSEVIDSLARMLREYDKDTEEHVARLKKLTARMGERIGLTESDQSRLALLSIFHDVGRLGIPSEILSKSGKLTNAEWKAQMAHVEKGARMAENTAELRDIAQLIRYHHERWDGRGYPDGLSKESIPLLARLFAVVDAYDTMTNDRPYRKAMSVEAACQEIRRCAGTQFDPALVSELIRLLQDEGILKEEIAVESSAGAQEDEGIGKAADAVGRAGNAGRAEAAGKASDAGIGDAADTGIENAADTDKPGGVLPQTEWSLGNREIQEEIPRVHRMNGTRYITDAGLRIREADDEFCRLTGYSRAELAAPGLTQLDLIYEEDRLNYMPIVADALQKQKSCVYLEHWIRRRDGGPVFVNCTVRRIHESGSTQDCYEFIMGDASDSYSVQSAVQLAVQEASDKSLRRLEQWENMYRRDSLTGLLTHKAFQNDVEARILAGETQALMLMMDVDHFKEYNDTFGHKAGDEFLQKVSKTLLSCLRDDDFASRMGGDEFAAFLFFQDESQKVKIGQRAFRLCEEINRKLAEYDGGFTSVSMGGAFLDEEHDTFESLYNAADEALYRSKEGGRGRMSF